MWPAVPRIMRRSRRRSRVESCSAPCACLPCIERFHRASVGEVLVDELPKQSLMGFCFGIAEREILRFAQDDSVVRPRAERETRSRRQLASDPGVARAILADDAAGRLAEE